MPTSHRGTLKKKFKIFLSVFLLTLFPLLLCAEEGEFGLDIFGGETAGVKFEGKIFSKLNSDLHQDSKYEFTEEWITGIYLSFSGDIKSNFSFFSSFLDKYYYFHSSYNDYFNNRFQPFEFYVKKSSDKWDITAGNQIVSWGVSDVSPIDVVNPQEMDEFIFSEEDFAKLPVLMLRGDYYVNDQTTIEGIYVPFYKPSHFVLINSDWSILPREMYYRTVEEYRKEYGVNIEESGTTSYVTDYPKNSPFNGEIGFLLKSYREGYDYQVAIHYGWEKMPFPEFNPDLVEYLKSTDKPMDALNNLSPLEQISFLPMMKFKPHRIFTFGGGISTTFKSVGIRSEGALHTNSSIYNVHLELLHVPSLTWNIGADYNFPHNLYGNILITWVHFFTNAKTYLFKRDNIFTISLLRGSYFHDTLTLEGRFIFALTQYQMILSLKATYQYSDFISFFGSLNIIDAEKDSLLYQFRKNDFLTTGIRYSF